MLAHFLVKHAKGIIDFSTWIEENPYFLKKSLLDNVISFESD